MKTKLYILIASLIAVLCLSCYDNEGNYDYTDLTLAEISGIDKEYTKISYKDTLFINPEIKPANAHYEYIWTINQAYDHMPSMGKFVIDTIGTDKNLVYAIDKPTGRYDINLKVINQDNGDATFYNTILVAQTEFTSGFYVLKEMEGNTEVDLHLPSKEVVGNLLSKSLGSPLSGKPTSMGIVFEYSFIDPATNDYVKPAPMVLTVCAGKDAYILNLQDMSTVFSHSTMFYGDAPVDETPLYIYPNAFCIAYLSDKGVYSNYQVASWGMFSAGKFGVPNVIEGNCKPNINMTHDGMNTYLFDELNHRFLTFDFNAQYHTFSNQSEAGGILPDSPNNIPADYQLAFFGHNTIGGNYGYALFKDSKSAQKHYLYTLNLKGDFNPIEKVEEIAASLQLNKASLFAINENDARMLYYVADNQLYRYEIEQKSETPITLQGFEGGEITYISNRYWTGTNDKDNNFNHLAVGAYKDGQYAIYLYDMIGGIPSGAPKRVLKGEGKAMKLHFVSPNMGDNSSAGGSYPISY